MTRHAELEADSPRPEPKEESAPHSWLRTLTSVELPDRHRPAQPAQGVGQPKHAATDARRPTRRPRPGGHGPGEVRAPGASPGKGDSASPFRPSTHCVWTVVDTYQVDGAQYVVVRLDQLPPGAARALSRRESQAVALAVHGHTNKVIAFEMGASASTVGVLLYRAARKLGSRTRAELVSSFLGLAANEASPATHSCTP